MDLSKLLGDLYATDEDRQAGDEPAEASGQPGPRSVGAPEWADESRLDEAFASWKPGPPDDAPAAERDMADVHATSSFPQLEAALAEPDEWSGGSMAPSTPAPPVEVGEGMALTDQSGDEGREPTVMGEPRLWTRADDDVLPRRRSGRRGLRLSLRRR